MTAEIFPLDKVLIDGTAISLGMERSAIEAAIGKGQPIGKRYYYFNSEMAIDYNGGKAEFIEFLGGPDGTLKPAIYGVSVFEAQADELFNILKAQNSGPICDAENGCSYQFPRISVGIYREAVPQKVEEMIEEATNSGVPMSDDEIQYERDRADHWATLGLGLPGYYQR